MTRAQTFFPALLYAALAALPLAAGGGRPIPVAGGAGPRYAVTDLGALPYLADDVAMDINAGGQVSLWVAVQPPGVVHAALWSGQDVQDLGSPVGCPNSVARGVNDAGQAAGWTSTSANPVDSLATVRAAVYDHGRTRELGTLGGRDSRAFALNAAGQVVGVADTAGGHRHAFLAAGDALTDLGTLPGGGFSQAYAINRSGHIAGVSDSRTPEKRAVLWRGGRIMDLGTLPGGRTSSARALNSRDQAAGYSECPDGYHAALWADGQVRDLGTLGGQPSAAYGLNDREDVVGVSSLSGAGRHAFLWHGGRLIDLNSLIRPDLGWVLTRADAINDRGQIVCVGDGPGRPPHALLLTPLP